MDRAIIAAVDVVVTVDAVDSGFKSSILFGYILANPVERFFLVGCCCILELFYAGVTG